MRRISRQVIFETGSTDWTGDQRLKDTGTLLAHIKKHHTEDCHVTGCKATIAFRKIDETDQIENCKAFFPPILDGKNIVAAIDKNLCPFCEIERARKITAACLSALEHGRESVHAPKDSDYRYEIDADGRLWRQLADPSGKPHSREWFDFTKGFWFTDPDRLSSQTPDP